MKTGVLFYRLLSDHPRIFFEIIGHPPEEAQDYKLEAVEIKQTSYRIDGVFRPAPGAVGKPVYFVEIQCQRNDHFYYRLFARIFNFFDQQKQECTWYAWALFAERAMDPGVPEQYRHFTPDILKRYYLEDLLEEGDLPPELELIRLIVTPENQAVGAVRRVLRTVEEDRLPGTTGSKLIESVETILVYKFPQLSRKEIENMFNLVDLKDTRVYQEAFEEGEKKGEERGEKKGEIKGRLVAVPLLLESGFTAERIAAELGLDAKTVRQRAAELAAPEARKPGRRPRRKSSES